MIFSKASSLEVLPFLCFAFHIGKSLKKSHAICLALHSFEQNAPKYLHFANPQDDELESRSELELIYKDIVILKGMS